VWNAVIDDEKAEQLIDRPVVVKCPHCNVQSNLTAVSIPRISQAKRYGIEDVIVGFRCDACNKSVALRFDVQLEVGRHARTNKLFEHLQLSDQFSQLERQVETFEYQHLPGAVASDLREALTSYSHLCPNAAAAMCRRTLQSVATDLGASGTDKVQKQLLEAKETAGIDEETYAGLKEIMICGHDGAHPHLPDVSPERAAVLVEIVKDVLTQIYVRKARIQESMSLRQAAIDAKKAGH
jgi:hypothetical protein